MKRTPIWGLMILLFGCNSSHKYWNISKFNLVPNALVDYEVIKLIYSSPTPDDSKDLDYYIQVVVVSQKSGDTVNVLTTLNNGFILDDSSRTFNYLGPENPATKISQMDFDKLAGEKDMEEKIAQTKLSNITRVTRDPKYDDIADNKFPTVIGTIGTVTNIGNQ